MSQSESIKNLAEALSKAQAEFKPVPKTKTATVTMKSGGKYQYHYADLADVLNMALPVLARHGLTFSQPTTLTEGKLRIASELMHVSGEWKRTDGIAIPENLQPQDFGSVFTYWRRYDGCGLLAIAPDEDVDGKTSSKIRRDNITTEAEGFATDEPIDFEHLPPAKCYDCGRGIAAYTDPKTQKVIPPEKLIEKSKKLWRVSLCAGCAIKRTREQPASTGPVPDDNSGPDVIRCRPVSVEEDGKALIVKWWNGEKQVSASCFDRKLWDTLSKTQAQDCVFRVKYSKGYVNITGITQIGGLDVETAETLTA